MRGENYSEGLEVREIASEIAARGGISGRGEVHCTSEIEEVAVR